MSRGFGATDGSGTTDKIASTYSTAVTTTVSYSIWVWRTTDGTAGEFQRILDQDTGVRIAHDNDFGSYFYAVPWSGTDGIWDITPPATGAWVHLGITYNGGATTNDPIFYINGSAVSIIAEQTPTGTIGTGTGAFTFGNLAASNRVWNGKLAEIAIWTGVILTSGNMAALAAGVPPLQFSPSSITFYAPFWGDQVLDEGSGHSTLTVTGALAKDDPPVRRPFFPLAAHGGSAGDYPQRLVA